VLVHEADMPTEDQLPPELKSLARRQAVTLTDANWESDVAQLVSTLRGLLGTVIGAKRSGGLWQSLIKLSSRPVPIALVVALLAGTYAWRALKHPGADIALSQPVVRTSAGVVPIAGTDEGATSPREVLVAPPEGTLHASTSALDFGALRLGENEVQTVRITNGGTGVVALSQIGFAGAAQDDFSFERKCERKELTPNASCDVRVRFAPSEPGPRKALLSVEYYGRTSPLVVKLWGSGASKSQTSATPQDASKIDKLSSAAKQQE
jgi:hypothetical protein